ncbi:MAG: hypothetical protein DDT40_00023 [candidate division WS2 bacterium]|uniref:Putative Se/S carrier protein-like domain-containing protein n=1 Tax=Psychracetigena formicireducens TaxID=2986056 RepID=A0A9E2BFB4_PSYF1|nr:hypothetical protein [Candidatus Psychracetigena formicireducens]MBT9144556.1 hypothetical protein [Candidatus Psychracetigena formicireducens]MBT9149859.1 hypothetical protein [Candidatus Psychracetigena formicireducens]
MILIRLPTPNWILKVNHILEKEKIPHQIIPTPKELDPSCNLSILIDEIVLEQTIQLLETNEVPVDDLLRVSNEI